MIAFNSQLARSFANYYIACNVICHFLCLLYLNRILNSTQLNSLSQPQWPKSFFLCCRFSSNNGVVSLFLSQCRSSLPQICLFPPPCESLRSVQLVLTLTQVHSAFFKCSLRFFIYVFSFLFFSFRFHFSPFSAIAASAFTSISLFLPSALRFAKVVSCNRFSCAKIWLLITICWLLCGA